MIKPRSGQLNILNEFKTDSVNNRLIVASSNNVLHYFYMENGRIHSFYVEKPLKPHIGDIYIGLVTNVCKSIDGYFVDIDEDNTVFLSGKNISNSILSNRVFDGKLHQSDLIIVQITKEEHGTKKAAATANIKYNGLITKEKIEMLSRTKTKYSLLFKGPRFLDILENANTSFENTSIICADQYSYEYIVNHYKNTNDHLQFIENEKIKLYNDEKISLGALYSLKSRFDDITNEKVWLKSGGYLFINPTEALTVIDINTGKSNGKNRDATIMATNTEAIEEIAHQYSFIHHLHQFINIREFFWPCYFCKA